MDANGALADFTGVVHEDVDRPEALLNLCDDAGDGVAIGDVAGQRQHVCSRQGNITGHRRQGRGIATGRRDGVAVPGEAVRDGFARAARGTCDENHRARHRRHPRTTASTSRRKASIVCSRYGSGVSSSLQCDSPLEE